MSKPRLTIAPDGTEFRDLDKDGVMAPYEDPRLSTVERVADLVQRMTLEEKAGTMMQPILETRPDGGVIEGDGVFGHSTNHILVDQAITSVSALQLPDPTLSAQWSNTIQDIAAGTRLGIPVTLFTDPRHAFTENLGTSLAAGAFSQWPESLGFGAIGDPAVVEEFASIARQEYLAVGLRGALHPQLDLATEPRWARQGGGFGVSSAMTAEFAEAYVRGFQGDRLTGTSVACMAKHFPGGGSQRDGEDPHFEYGREQVYSGGMFEYHLAPFRRAIEAGVAAMMPYYSLPIGYRLPDGETAEEVAFAFNRSVITRLLREELGYDGIVCTDYGIITDDTVQGLPFPARAWGVEHLSEIDRVEQVILAGCDQFGGEARPELIVELVTEGRVTEARIDESVRRVLALKFDLGLFEDPYVDSDRAAEIVGSEAFVAAGMSAQRRSITPLKNDPLGNAPTLPLASGTRVYAPGVDPDVLARYAVAAADPTEADVAVVRLEAPFEERSTYFLESKFRAGSLAFSHEEIDRIGDLAQQVPVVIDVYLDRPALLEPILEHAHAMTASYGSSDEALLDVLFGRARAEGRLPFEIPRSMDAVRASRPDVPSDTLDPVLPVGFRVDLEASVSTVQG